MIPISFTPTFCSYFDKELMAFLVYKRSCGYVYQSEAQVLARIDKFFYDNNICELNEHTLEGWTNKTNTESPKTHAIRYTVLNQFINYMNKYDYSIVMPYKIKGNIYSKSFTPYIFTKKEIYTILHYADTMTVRRKTANIYNIMPVLLRLLYCCGLRVNEATSLKVENIDFQNNTITILDSKNDNCRILPITENLKTIILNYINKLYDFPKDENFVFPAKDKTQISNRYIYSTFRELLWQSAIPHGGKGKGPRLHDLRHTFAVHSLQKLVIEGKDTYLILPILSTYLGHKNIYATERYLRLTAEIYPDILEKIESTFGKILSEVQDYEIN